MAKKLAVIGSSGGNLYNQGGADPKAMMKEVFTQAASAGIEVAFVQFVGTSQSMDSISQDAKARLWTLADAETVEAGEEMTLAEVNGLARSARSLLFRRNGASNTIQSSGPPAPRLPRRTEASSTASSSAAS